MNIVDEVEAKGEAKGYVKGEVNGSLNVLNVLANDPSCSYSVEGLAEKFGFSVEEILNGK